VKLSQFRKQVSKIGFLEIGSIEFFIVYAVIVSKISSRRRQFTD
jgi:hypothetical protein